MVNFYPVITEDNTISLFNTEVNDIYHSKIGAYTESFKKFVVPSGMLDYVKSHNSISILDVCYGLGYNSIVAVNEIWKVNPACKISICCLESDPYVLAYSCLINMPEANSRCKEGFIAVILSNYRIQRLLKIFMNDVTFNQYIDLNNGPFLKSILSRGIKIYVRYPKRGTLHNIYYRSVSIRNKNVQKFCNCSDLLDVTFYMGDARQSVLGLNTCYNYIMHDPFTPSKAPCLWTVDFFRELYKLLDDNGNITTYSSSAAVRSGLIDAGFFIGLTEPIGKKASGTIAYKEKRLLKDELSEYDLGLLNTKSGIPYYDPDLNFTNEEIQMYRENIRNNSNRISSSRYIKEYSTKNC